MHTPNGQLNMTQKTDMTLFRLTDWSLSSKTHGDGLRVTISMQRIFTSELMTTYFPEWNFVYFISFILRLEWQDEVGMTKNSHSRVILKGMMIERYLTSHPSSRSFEVILTWNDLRMTKYPHSVVIPGWLGMNFRLHEKSPDFWAGPWRVQGMMWNDARMM